MEIDQKKNNKWNSICFYILIFVISGIFGFIYETLFYRIDLGYFVKRGTTIGPWIPIYGFGGIGITALATKYRKNPFIVFILCTIITGILEYITGYMLYNIGGIRLWDYNTEIWNWGNIGGFICFRSILFFGISGLLLIYSINPLLKKFIDNTNKTVGTVISFVPGVLFAIDIIINTINI